jgi:hypothetical protein
VKPPPVRRPPRERELTEERRAAILAAYQAQPKQENEPLRRVFARIAAELNVTRQMVAEVLQRVAARREVPDAVREAVGQRYQEFVRKMERPPESRHRALAREFGLSGQQVNELIFTLAQILPDPSHEEPIVRFRIEQAYWRALKQGHLPLDAIADAIAAEQGVAPWTVARYLDLIHDDPAKLRTAPLPDTATQQRILAGYERFLGGDAPYPEGLHATLAAETGATVRQVHRVLLEHRWAVRRAATEGGEGGMQS